MKLVEKMDVNWLKNKKYLVLLVIAIISGVICFITYPGYMYTDTYSRISFVNLLPRYVELWSYGYDDLIPIRVSYVPALWMYVLNSVSGGWGLYIFLQSFLFLLASYWFGITMCDGNAVATIIVMVISPIYLFYSVFWECSVGSITLIMFLILLWKKASLKEDKLPYGYVLLTMFCIYMIIGYRPNAATIIPALIIGILDIFKEKKNRIRMIFGIVSGYLLLLATPSLLHIDTMNTQTMGMVWEMVSMIDNMEDQSKYVYYLDLLKDNGATKEALANNTYKDSNASVNDIWWGAPFEMENIDGDLTGAFIAKKYTNLIKAYPKLFLKVKSIFAANTLGFNGALRDREYYYNRNDRMEEFGMRDGKGRHFIFDSFIKYNETIKIHRYPWVFFLIAFVLYGTKCFRLKKINLDIMDVSACIATFYYGAFLINTQAFEFRYFFPSWVLLVWYIVGTILRLLIKEKKIETN